MAKKEMVLVTGATGFIAKHCILTLLKQGYQVRGSLRSMDKAEVLKTALSEHTDVSDLSFVELNLMSDEGWDDAVKGCTYVQHVASPFPATEPQNEDELIIPAREGALRALRAAAKAKVKRVVLTSSMAAVAYGVQEREPGPFTEKDWTNSDSPVGAYLKSKTIAERAAWDFIASKEAGDMELSVINPGAVLGPVLDSSWSTSGELVRKLLRKEMPACPRISFAMIDVRDVAEAHYRAMILPEAAGERFLLVTESAWMVEISRILHANGFDTPTKELPDFLVRFFGMFDKTIKMVTRQLGKSEDISNEKLRTVLQIEPRDLEEMSVSMAKSMEKYGLV